MSKTKSLIGGKTLSLWIPDEEWVDDFNHLLAKRTKTDRSITRNALFLQCVEVGLNHLDDKQETDSIRIHLDAFPEEQAAVLRTPAGKQLVSNLLSALLAGQLAPLQSSAIEVAATKPIDSGVQSFQEQPREVLPPTPPPVIKEPEPIEKKPEKKIPDLFHTLMRNSSLS